VLSVPSLPSIGQTDSPLARPNGSSRTELGYCIDSRRVVGFHQCF
jgi:hypothetical protein